MSCHITCSTFRNTKERFIFSSFSTMYTSIYTYNWIDVSIYDNAYCSNIQTVCSYPPTTCSIPPPSPSTFPWFGSSVSQFTSRWTRASFVLGSRRKFSWRKRRKKRLKSLFYSDEGGEQAFFPSNIVKQTSKKHFSPSKLMNSHFFQKCLS